MRARTTRPRRGRRDQSIIRQASSPAWGRIGDRRGGSFARRRSGPGAATRRRARVRISRSSGRVFHECIPRSEVCFPGWPSGGVWRLLAPEAQGRVIPMAREVRNAPAMGRLGRCSRQRAGFALGSSRHAARIESGCRYPWPSTWRVRGLPLQGGRSRAEASEARAPGARRRSGFLNVPVIHQKPGCS